MSKAKNTAKQYANKSWKSFGISLSKSFFRQKIIPRDHDTLKVVDRQKKNGKSNFPVINIKAYRMLSSRLLLLESWICSYYPTAREGEALVTDCDNGSVSF
jgi:hypothetical protein